MSSVYLGAWAGLGNFVKVQRVNKRESCVSGLTDIHYAYGSSNSKILSAIGLIHVTGCVMSLSSIRLSQTRPCTQTY